MRFKILISFVFWIVLFGISNSLAQRTSIFGKWQTIDDNTEKPRSIVEIYKKDGKAFGKIEKLILEPHEDPDPVCDKCDEDDQRYNQKVIGMEIIKNLVKDDDEWEDGTILDPDNGSVYDCKLWVEDGKLQVRGYIMFFFRTQEWLPTE
ncbi:MAG: hypothetical protein COA57_15040 [Flavobacteriales bacterium]|nr:MAG: hypothetical protein COA57_15040 [Flavobacteriales bacterium]